MACWSHLRAALTMSCPDPLSAAPRLFLPPRHLGLHGHFVLLVSAAFLPASSLAISQHQRCGAGAVTSTTPYLCKSDERYGMHKWCEWVEGMRVASVGVGRSIAQGYGGCDISMLPCACGHSIVRAALVYVLHPSCNALALPPQRHQSTCSPPFTISSFAHTLVILICARSCARACYIPICVFKIFA